METAQDERGQGQDGHHQAWRLHGASMTAAKIDQIIGKRARLAMAEVRQSIYVPLIPKPSSPLATMVGLGNAIKLSQVFGGQVIDLPKSAAEKLARRNAKIKEAAQRGQTVRQLASDYCLTDRQVRNVLKTRAKS